MGGGGGGGGGGSLMSAHEKRSMAQGAKTPPRLQKKRNLIELKEHFTHMFLTGSTPAEILYGHKH